ncbi:NFXL1 [Mytilus edulis]|uniref:NFXL1 n=1 Tax=Mytilus edulis TaxID=6550 RepID=A0A8S3UFV4_MYTED|nr:NFXL1 [Mytilus edulis]
MAESEIKNASIALYDHLCQNIVGSEDYVKTLRMMNTVRDNLQSNKTFSLITSGSFGEGLDMRGSDLDIMAVLKQIEILEDKHMYLNADKTYFTMELGDTQPGFTKLLLEHSNDPGIRIFCVEIGGDFYLSNLLVKKEIIKRLVFDFQSAGQSSHRSSAQPDTCFCEKVIEPKFDPWLVPHSCGQTCGKVETRVWPHMLTSLSSSPCTPCPKTVVVTCYCQKQSPQIKRCSARTWSCGQAMWSSANLWSTWMSGSFIQGTVNPVQDKWQMYVFKISGCEEMCPPQWQCDERPPLCHHPATIPHACHFGECPPCRLQCLKKLSPCSHPCPMMCHPAVKVKIKENLNVAGPWEGRPTIREEIQDKPCPPCKSTYSYNVWDYMRYVFLRPPCKVPIAIQCLGLHETGTFACSEVRPYSCGRSCDRLLSCGNHTCQLPCHQVNGAKENGKAGDNCSPCEEGCDKPARWMYPQVSTSGVIPGDCPLARR